MRVELHAHTDVGRVRQGNEDNFLVVDLTTERSWTGSDKTSEPPAALLRFDLGEKGAVFAVSDGMGGALAGDVASRMAVETVRDMLVDEDTVLEETQTGAEELPLVEAVRNATGYANYAIHRKSVEDPKCSGMGATLTAAAINSDSVELLQVGDSRAYLIRGDEIKLATKDQSLVQQLVDVGQISEEDAETHMFRNVILQALGAQSELAPVVSRAKLQRGDILLLCSDGLSGKLRAEDMRDIIAGAGGDLSAACTRLIEEANARGGEDNITVLLARFDGEDLAARDAEAISVETQPTDLSTFHEYSEDDTSPIP
ncbi:MAG: protein phosphatase 2C domain-containing protein [Acidobacteria bacterium]|nr:protein phosphatase 2C domain-containing protein [Acidobacteriota bacterium]MCA1641860.1 protein phosphatase 2C domain-containing protein [Acidobacteriota bacterium]